MQVKLSEATATQLAEFATVSYGLDVTFRTGVEAIKAKLASVGFSKDFIDIDEPSPSPTQKTEPDIDGRKYVIITIAEQETPGGGDPVPVCVNGKAMFIPRNQECRVAVEYVEALKNAVQIVYPSKSDGGLGEPRRVPAYPFSIIRAAA